MTDEGLRTPHIPSPRTRNILCLLALTFGALLVHGYHPFAEDAEIYLPGVEKILDPGLFPFGAEFFQSHAHLTLFPNLIAASVRVTHLSLEAALFLWQLLSIFLLLWAGWQLSGKCFADARARWAGVALLAALLTLPVAGTGLYILDQYLNPRNLTAFAGILAIVKVLDKKYVHAGLILVISALLHPLMSVFALSYCVLVVGMERLKPRPARLALLLPLGISFGPPPEAYREVARTHTYFFLMRWAWYEWLGALAPIATLWWFGRVARAKQQRNLELLCRALVIYQVIYTVAALLISIPTSLEGLALLQPMRSLFLLYIMLILFGGGMLAEYVLKNSVGRWLVLFVPLCAGMFIAQRELFPASAHVELPGMAPRNPWVQAFVWVRENTPRDAIFALDPEFMHRSDENGFRAIAQRSRMADEVKDSGVVTMFPPLADEWLQQVDALRGWKNFQLQDVQRLRERYGVGWVVVEPPGVAGLECPYRNDVAMVCKL